MFTRNRPVYIYRKKNLKVNFQCSKQKLSGRCGHPERAERDYYLKQTEGVQSVHWDWGPEEHTLWQFCQQ